MSDQKKDKEIQEIYVVDSDKESSEVQDSGAVIQMVQDILKESANEQFENVVDGNETVVTNSNKAPEMLQTKEIGKEGLIGSLMPHESVQAPVNELPRNNEEKKDITSASVSQPSKRRRRSSTGGISINTEAAETAEYGGLRRSSRIKQRNDAENANQMYEDPYFFGKRPLYMEKKRDEYAYVGEDSEYEDDEWD